MEVVDLHNNSMKKRLY